MFIAAGGRAEWIMTVFAHNEHQVSECRELAMRLGFARFIARHSDRPPTPARDRDGVTTHWVLPASTSTVTAARVSEAGMRAKESRYKQGNIQIRQEHNNIALPSLDNCDSIRLKSIYIGANWSVAPCCFIGALSFTGKGDGRYDNFINALAGAGLTENDLIAHSTVREVVEQGFDFVYDRITTESALTACFKHCHPDKSNYRVSQATKAVTE